ncbi:MAG: dinitrogenase iron-molybdenum cofactor biosynthesis protein [Proteobacteria bacterium]|nr:dinitrogenase iron-molybdenum cofactor biosynthesis protein [Pseudomonadota bacterium]
MRRKILIPLFGNEVAPRFDLATEVVIVSLDEKSGEREEKTLVLPQNSAEQLCHLVLTEGVQVVICGGIEEEYYRYLAWKKVRVFDSIMGDWEKAFDSYNKGELQTGKNPD